MSRYIDGDALTERILGTGIVTKTEETQSLWHALQTGVVEYINRMPTADVVEVVRCKDCKHRPVYKDTEIHAPQDHRSGWSDWACPYLCSDWYYNRMPKDNDFCSHGERRDE